MQVDKSVPGVTAYYDMTTEEIQVILGAKKKVKRLKEVSTDSMKAGFKGQADGYFAITTRLYGTYDPYLDSRITKAFQNLSTRAVQVQCKVYKTPGILPGLCRVRVKVPDDD